MNTRIKAGITVQNNSRGWDSVVYLSMFELNIIEFMLNPTMVIIKTRVVIA